MQILTSAGGLVEADHFVGKDSILSGPAGGVVGFSQVAQAAGFERAIGFDMGGTSTDVSRFDGRYELEYETEKAGVRVVAPMMAIETVAAGGGSICRFDGVKLTVGPESAAADPGPACYGRGGPLAVTDVNFYQGKILAEHFPFPLDRAGRRVAACRRSARRDRPSHRHATTNRTSWPTGFLPRRQRQHGQGDPLDLDRQGRRSAGLRAGGLRRGRRASTPAPSPASWASARCSATPDAGILSAYGIGLADVVRHRVAGVYQPYSESAVAELEPTFRQLADEACGGDRSARDTPESRSRSAASSTCATGASMPI